MNHPRWCPGRAVAHRQLPPGSNPSAVVAAVTEVPPPRGHGVTRCSASHLETLVLAARLGDKGPAPCRAGPPGLTHSPSWAQRPAGRLALGGASPGGVCPGQGPRGPSLRVPWRLRLAPRSLLSHLADPAKPLPLPTCSQVELMPAGCPGSCLLAPAVGFPGAPCPVPSPGKGLHPGTGEPQGLPRLCPTLWGPAVGGGRGSFFSPPPRAVLQAPPCRKTSCVHPGLRNKLHVFGNR